MLIKQLKKSNILPPVLYAQHGLLRYSYLAASLHINLLESK